jgi:hypothetical protein
VNVESVLGVGSAFTLDLPLVFAEPADRESA